MAEESMHLWSMIECTVKLKKTHSSLPQEQATLAAPDDITLREVKRFPMILDFLHEGYETWKDDLVPLIEADQCEWTVDIESK